MRLSTKSSVDLRQSILTEALTGIMLGLQKRVKVQKHINMTITITVLTIIQKVTIHYVEIEHGQEYNGTVKIIMFCKYCFKIQEGQD